MSLAVAGEQPPLAPGVACPSDPERALRVPRPMCVVSGVV